MSHHVRETKLKEWSGTISLKLEVQVEGVFARNASEAEIVMKQIAEYSVTFPNVVFPYTEDLTKRAWRQLKLANDSANMMEQGMESEMIDEPDQEDQEVADYARRHNRR